MRQLLLISAFAAGLMVTVPAVAAEPEASAPPAVATPSEGDKPAVSAKDDPNRIVCRRERVAGSNRPVKTCRTAAEWKAERDEAASAMRGGMGGSRPAGGLGAAPGPGV